MYIRLSVCFVVFLTLAERAAHSHGDSPGGSMRRSQRIFRFDNKKTDVLVILVLLINK